MRRERRGWLSPQAKATSIFVLMSVFLLVVDELVDAYEKVPSVFLLAHVITYTLMSVIAGLAIYSLVVRTRRADEERYTSFVQHALDISGCGIFILDADFRVVWANQAVDRYFGLLGTETVGRDMREFVRTRLHHAVEDAEGFASRLLATYDYNNRIAVFECHVLPSRGREERWLQHWSQPIRAGLYVGGRIEHYSDITERRRAEEKVQQREAELAHIARINVLGELAATLAHEINQPLGTISNYAAGCVQRLRAGKAAAPDLLAVLEEVASEAQRAGCIIHRIRDFLRKEPPRYADADINQLVSEAASLVLAAARKEGITVGLELAEGLPPVCVDSIQIEQVVLNLLKNGMDSIVSTGSVERELTVRTSSPAPASVEITIIDTGAGLPEGLSDELFAPFFTTKPDGMGMGLSICRSIVESHRGRVWATAGLAGGAVFHVTLPVTGTSQC